MNQISVRKNTKMRVGVDRSLYRPRKRVERCFNRLKNARRVAIRYHKAAESFLGYHRHRVQPTLASPFVNMN